jgi:hypothetical protein
LQLAAQRHKIGNLPIELDWFDDLNSSLVADLLQRWPTLEELQHAHRGTLRKFFHAHNCRSEERIQERIEGIYQATPETKVISPYSNCGSPS